MKGILLASTIAVLPLAAAAQMPWPPLAPPITPPVCLKADGKTPESCQMRQCRALGMDCYEPSMYAGDAGHANPAVTRDENDRPRPELNHKVFPPAEYDKPYQGKVIEIRAEPALMVMLCPKTIYNPTLACSFAPKGESECLIVMAADKYILAQGWTAEIIRRHELAHCNGWTKDHPGMRAMTSQERAQYFGAEAKR